MKTLTKFYFLTFLILFFVQINCLAYNYWEGILSTNSGGQKVYAIVDNKLYHINNSDWIYISDLNTIGLIDLIVDKNEDIYAIYSNSIKKSIDEGNSWSEISGPISESYNGAKIIDNYIYLGFNQKIYRGDLSTENINWELIYEGGYYDITLTQNNEMYIVPQLIKSSDNGTTWVQTDSNWPEEANSTRFVINHKENTVFVGTYWDGILFSNDGGNTWNKSSGLPENRGVNAIYVYNHQVFVMVGDQKGNFGLYSSDNNGISFYKTNTGLSVWVEQNLSKLTAENTNYYINVGKRGFYYSNDSGNSWQECNNGNDNIYPHDVQQIQVEDNGTIWTLMAPQKCQGPNPSFGILKSTDRGQTWLDADVGLWEEYLTLEDLLVTNDGKAIIANYNPGTINFSNDGGITWTNDTIIIDTLNYGEGLEFVRIESTIDFFRTNISKDTIFAGTYWDGIIRSIDGGHTWTKQTNGLPLNSGVHDIFVDSNSIYAIIGSQAGYDGIYISNDHGDNWTKVSSKSLIRIIKNEGVLYGYGVEFSNELGRFSYNMYVSYDNGATWSIIDSGLPSTEYKIYDFIIAPVSLSSLKISNSNEKKILLSTSDGIYQMNIGDNTFTKVSNILAFKLFWDSYSEEIIIGNENGIAIASAEQTAYTLTIQIEGNGSVLVDGENYSQPITFEEIVEIYIQALPESGWQFDEWTGDLESTNMAEHITVEENKTITVHFSQITGVSEADMNQIVVYPNPFCETLTLSGIQNSKEYKILNLLGEQLISNELNGNEKEVVNSSFMKPGIYCIIIKTNNAINEYTIIKE